MFTGTTRVLSPAADAALSPIVNSVALGDCTAPVSTMSSPPLKVPSGINSPSAVVTPA